MLEEFTKGFGLRLLLSGIVLSSCGVEVRVGRNAEPDLLAQDRLYPDDEGEVLMDDLDALPPGVDADGTEDGGPVSCQLNLRQLIDSTQELEDQLEDMCKVLAEGRSGPYAYAHQHLCLQKTFLSLLSAPCAWQGEGRAQSYLKVLEQTPLDQNSEMNFNFKAASSVVIQAPPLSFVDRFYQMYADPGSLPQLPKVDGLSLSAVNVDRDQQRIGYTLQLQTSAATIGYRGQIDVIQRPTGAVLIFDRALDQLRVVVEQSYLTLVFALPEGGSLILGIDNKVVQSLGNHRIAQQSSVRTKVQRMELNHVLGKD